MLRRKRWFGSALAAVFLQLWSLTPVSASVVYCIGSDGHSGFELVSAGAADCSDCCPHDEHDSGIRETAGNACTDVALSAASALSGKAGAPQADFAIAPATLPASGRLSQQVPRAFDPPRSSASVLIRSTVLRL